MRCVLFVLLLVRGFVCLSRCLVFVWQKVFITLRLCTLQKFQCLAGFFRFHPWLWLAGFGVSTFRFFWYKSFKLVSVSSPFLFVLVMDYVLRALRSDNGVPVTNKRSDGTFLRLPALAYADDVVLLAESPRLLQQNLHLLQERAATVGLRLNLGANKTEWFSTTADAGSEVRLIDGRLVQRVTSYKYLGLKFGEIGFQRKESINAARGKAWAALKAFDKVWKSSATQQAKRSLAIALITPFLTYAVLAWPIHKTVEQSLDITVNALLRHALNVPSVFHGGPHTSELYGDFPRISTLVRQQRLQLLGHWIREHFEGERWHWAVPVILFDPDTRIWPRRPGGQLRMVLDSVKSETQLDTVDDIVDVALCRRQWQAVVKRVIAT